MVARIFGALAGALCLGLVASAAQANSVDLKNENTATTIGTLSCGAAAGVCAGFIDWAPDLTPPPAASAGTQSPTESDAWNIGDASQANEVSFLNAIAGTNFTGTQASRNVTGGPGFSISLDYFILKVGNQTAFFRKLIPGTLNFTYTAVPGQGAGLSHVTQVPIPAGIVLLLTALGGLFGWRRWGARQDGAPALA